ncbi:hypothetical protein BCR34DRAFT_224020 [Clohesyomyces aquaticus]|uniref:Uncharacterized protein n=1 Tax=Clohesyomyces aquaticus TaxID=1231657 RepID=A0A1Y1ZWP2_9PLEO|nr:hypothetical protein BCR34DRAFT_224020 [Clohesyomyces aquaticus]
MADVKCQSLRGVRDADIRSVVVCRAFQASRSTGPGRQSVLFLPTASAERTEASSSVRRLAGTPLGRPGESYGDENGDGNETKKATGVLLGPGRRHGFTVPDDLWTCTYTISRARHRPSPRTARSAVRRRFSHSQQLGRVLLASDIPATYATWSATSVSSFDEQHGMPRLTTHPASAEQRSTSASTQSPITIFLLLFVCPSAILGGTAHARHFRLHIIAISTTLINRKSEDK